MNRNEVVLVTGANQGIGFSMAHALLKRGYFVAGFDILIDNLSGLKDSFPERFIGYQTDVTDFTQVVGSVESLIRRWNKIDILVNNACLALFSPFEEKSISDTRREFDVNYFGYVHMITAVLPYMKERKTGIIHNVSSGVGITGFPGLSGYTSTKGAIEALSHTLACEFEKHGIVVATMHPPLTRTVSSAPLGIPGQVMADPVTVGEQLARRISQKKSAITPNLQTNFFLFVSRLFPRAVGRLLGKMTERGRGL